VADHALPHTVQRRDHQRELDRRCRLCRGLAGHARPLGLGRAGPHVPRRRLGAGPSRRARHGGVVAAPGVVQRADRDLGSFGFRNILEHAGGGAAGFGALHGHLRRLVRSLSRPGLPRGRVQAGRRRDVAAGAGERPHDRLDLCPPQPRCMVELAGHEQSPPPGDDPDLPGGRVVRHLPGRDHPHLHRTAVPGRPGGGRQPEAGHGPVDPRRRWREPGGDAFPRRLVEHRHGDNRVAHRLAQLLGHRCPDRHHGSPGDGLLPDG